MSPTTARGVPCPRTRAAFRLAQGTAVAVGLGAAILGTVPDFAAEHDFALTTLVLAVTALFAIEYVARLCRELPVPDVDPAHPTGASAPVRRHALAARLRQVTEPLLLIDLAAGIAVPAALLAGVAPADARLFAMVWLLKPVRHAPALDLLVRVVRNEREPLATVLLAFLTTLLLAATGAYLLERHAQPASFGSIPAALWWAITTLTTTGYGDNVVVTPLGRLLAGAVMVVGVAVIGLWTAILANGFAQELRRRDFLRTWDLVARVPLFAGVGAPTIADIARLLRPRDLPAGRVVVRKGEPGDCMYFVVGGEVEVQLTERSVRLGPGGFFGELALITGGPRVANVTTVQPTRLVVLDVADFRGLVATRPELARVIHAEASHRQAELHERR